MSATSSTQSSTNTSGGRQPAARHYSFKTLINAAAHWGCGRECSGSARAERPRGELRQPGFHSACGGSGAAGAAAAHWGRGGEDSGQRGR
eukprot:5627748-Pyramimonas_sp.AAC.1